MKKEQKRFFIIVCIIAVISILLGVGNILFQILV